VFAVIGSRIARDAQSNVFEFRATIDRVSQANLELRETAEALHESEQQLVSIYNTVRDVIFHLAVEPEGRFRFVSVNAAFLKVTGLSREMVVCKTVNEVIPGPSLAMVLGPPNEGFCKPLDKLRCDNVPHKSDRHDSGRCGAHEPGEALSSMRGARRGSLTLTCPN
jgi:hypothetical protein